MRNSNGETTDHLRIDDNRFFDLLVAEARDSLRANAEIVTLSRGQLFDYSLPRQPFVYFPLSCWLTLDVVMPSGARHQLCTIGPSGVVGVLPLLGTDLPRLLVSVITEGLAARVSAAEFVSTMQKTPALLHQFTDYIACLNRNVEQWMNMSITDRTHGREVATALNKARVMTESGVIGVSPTASLSSR